jgi:hypothetical protein
MLKKSVKWSLIYLLEAVAVLLALAIFGAGAILWRLSSGPVELDFLREDAQRMLAEAFEGDLVALGGLEARFDRDTRALVLSAQDVTVADLTGEVITRAPRIEAGLAIDALIFGRLEPVSLNVQGGSVSIVRRSDGAVGAGLGSVSRVAQTARLPERGGDDSASLFQILDDPRAASGPFARLSSVRIQSASVRIVDEQTDVDWLVSDAGVEFERSARQLRLAIIGSLATPSGFAPVELQLEAGADLENLLFIARFDQLSPAGVLPAQGPLAPLRALDAPVHFDVVVDATRENGIRSASLILDVGAGSLLTGGETRAIRGAYVSAGFDPVQGELNIHEGRIESDMLTVSLAGRVTELDGYIGALPTRGRFELAVGAGTLALGEVFASDPQWQSLRASGMLRLDELAVDFDTLALAVDNVVTRLSGTASLSQREDGRLLPELRLSGPIEGDVQPETVLAFWPVAVADSARQWVVEHVVSGRFFNARFELDLRAEDIEAGALPNDRMTLSFDFENARVFFLTTMTPITGGRGSAVLRGNAFEVDMRAGRIGDIELLSGFVDIPRLNPKGAVARYGGRARGAASEILALIDQPPMYFVSDYGLDPATVGGTGEMDFEISRAMLTEVPIEEIGFYVNGIVRNASLDVPGTDYRLSGGTVEVTAEPEGLLAHGDALLLDTPVTVTWDERFGLPDDEPSTRIALEAALSAQTLDVLNLPVRRYFDGPVRISANAISEGLDLHSVTLHADLTDALLEFPAGLWSKEPGIAGTADIVMSTDEDGRYLLDRVAVESEGLSLEAAADLSAEGRLERIDFSRFQLDGLADVEGGLVIPASTDGPIQLQVSGRYVDVSDFVGQISSAGEGGASLPLSINMDVGRLILSDRSVLDDFSLIWRSETAGIRAASVSGRGVDGPFQASFGARQAGEEREFSVRAQSLERIASLVGLEDYALGGQLAILGSAPPLGTEGPLTARIEVDDLTLVRVPVLARILAAGSFQGLAALLNGEGISFERVEADILYEDGLLTIGEARAAGNSLGVTAAGTIDFAGEQAAIDGNLAPSYVVNSMFGELPVIGDILVSRPGEGVIGITYSVEGPFDSLTVFANPLAAFAPGVLRRIFEGTAAERAARDRAEQPEPAPEPQSPEPQAPEPPLPE